MERSGSHGDPDLCLLPESKGKMLAEKPNKNKIRDRIC
jgi:hypothetical protein